MPRDPKGGTWFSIWQRAAHLVEYGFRLLPRIGAFGNLAAYAVNPPEGPYRLTAKADATHHPLDADGSARLVWP
jgi:hypothetical protein